MAGKDRIELSKSDLESNRYPVAYPIMAEDRGFEPHAR